MINPTTREQLEELLDVVNRQFERLLHDYDLSELTPKQRERLLLLNRSLHVRILKALLKLEYK
jgi:hypothetical protein